MPSVAISSVMPSWLTSWRSTSRSISQATATITAIAATKAEQLASERFSKPSQPGIHSREARHRQRGEQHHRALREVEDADWP